MEKYIKQGLISKNNLFPEQLKRDISESICIRDERSGIKGKDNVPITHVSRTSETNTIYYPMSRKRTNLVT